MSKLQELINKLCPNGVEYLNLGDVCEFKRGKALSSKNVIKGPVPVMAGGQKPSFYHNTPNRTGETIVVAGSGAYAGFVTYWNIPIFVSDAFSVHPNDRLLTKYVFYYLKNFQEKIHATKKGAGVPHVHGSDIAKFSIPVPPIEVQEEIVRILDSFSDYAAELQAELQARKQQYEYYRNLLLTFNPSAYGCGTDDEQKDGVTTWEGHNYKIQWKKLGEICNRICSGGTPTTSNKSFYNGSIPWLRTQEVNWSDVYDTEIKISEEAVKKSSAKLIPSNCVIIAMYGATAAKVCINRIPLTTNQACCNLEINPQLASYKYVYYWLCNSYEKLKSMGEGSQNNINGMKIKQYPIPIPPLELQEKIVAILDRFETLVNDLTNGLPAEIAAVKDQYEYYRNKLLTFKKLTA